MLPLIGSLAGMFAGGGTRQASSWSATRYGPGRAMGGPVFAGTPYLVGERGPELFYPRQSGSISNRGAGSTIHVSVTINATDAQSFVRSESQVAASVSRAISKATQRGG
ncbi:MAG: hypothetical protein JST40_12840 [Armatimonadetes bacterium]|nr:hypothetical protein [Armatimonadota bacterium]